MPNKIKKPAVSISRLGLFVFKNFTIGRVKKWQPITILFLITVLPLNWYSIFPLLNLFLAIFCQIVIVRPTKTRQLLQQKRSDRRVRCSQLNWSQTPTRVLHQRGVLSKNSAVSLLLHAACAGSPAPINLLTHWRLCCCCHMGWTRRAPDCAAL